MTVTVRNAHGKGPENVINHTARQAKLYSYDTVVALLDTDIAWTDKLKKQARQSRIEMVGSTPCFLGGLLLAILGKRPPMQSVDCKKVLAQHLGVDLMERQSYCTYFSRAVLDKARQSIAELDRLLKFYEER